MYTHYNCNCLGFLDMEYSQKIVDFKKKMAHQ